jgi:hypothetical protein
VFFERKTIRLCTGVEKEEKITWLSYRFFFTIKFKNLNKRSKTKNNYKFLLKSNKKKRMKIFNFKKKFPEK